MIDVHTIASFISQRYSCQYGSRIDEMKLHILLYFMQRECIVQTGNPVFEATFYAHTFGTISSGSSCCIYFKFIA